MMSPQPASNNEWVEIIEPKSKKRIFANLESGVCASSPPEGSIVSHSEDFSDHWWELYDNKTGKYYYYNPEQQKTAWTRPTESTSKRLLIIPVSRLQNNSKRLSPSHQDGGVEKVDVSTQTIASNLVSTGTQTISETVLEKEFNNKLRLVDLGQSSSSCTHQVDKNNKLHFNHRQYSDFNGKDRANYLKNRHISSKNRLQESAVDNHGSFNQNNNRSLDQTDNFKSYFGPTTSFGNSNERTPISIQSPAHKVSQRSSRSIDVGGSKSQHHQYQCSTSTFASASRPPPPSIPAATKGINQTPPQQLTTNNLSHYLVREARAMGIALISDDDLDDDEDDEAQDSDEDVECLRDDTSSHADLNISSQDLNGEDSSEGWKSFSDQDSPNSTVQNQNEFTFSELVDDEKNPSNCLSQQLDHRKLVENFKKLRQTSTLPRQRREKTAGGPNTIDADYDVVEENCGYYSDSEPLPAPVTLPNNSNSSLDFDNNHEKLSLSRVGPSQSPSNFDRYKSTRGSTFSVESFARENLSRHPKKGSLLFNRKVKWTRMITWTKSSIKQPMISSVSSDLNADSIASFKLIQQFMGDRKVNLTKNYRQILAQSVSPHETQQYQKDSSLKGKSLTRSNSINTSGTSGSNVSSLPTIPDRLRDELSYELVVKGCLKSPLRDEIFVQIARQLTDNPNQESVTWGLILLSILLSYFSPSTKFAPFLLSFLESHTHQMARDVCLPRLEKRLKQNWLTYCRKPADGKEISIVRLSITKWPQYCVIFGESLERIMSLQTCSPYLKNLRLPWILTTLGKKLLETGGLETEGIFRCAADHDLIAQLRLEIDCVDFRKITDAKQVHSLLSNVQDPHVIAGLLKLFFRQLYEPAFPSNIYDICLQNGQDGHMACRIFHEHLSNLNKDVVAYLIRLLQMLSKSDSVVAQTKMDSSNLSMVWAPNLLRLPRQQDSFSSSFNLESKNGSKWSIANGNSSNNNNEDSIKSSQSLIFEQTRQEMQFIRNLIVHLDTSFIENVI